jgi:sortase A
VSLPRLSSRAAAVIGGVGKALITGGVIVLLFAGYQLWGTGIQHDRAQDELEDEFNDDLQEAGEVRPSTTTTTASSQTTTSTSPSSASTTTGLPPEVVDDLASPADGSPVARIEMPTIGVNEIVVQGVSVADLRKGPGHYPNSAGFGEPGNAAIAGHRTTYGQPFHDLDQLEPGDEITVTTVRGSFTYEVMAHADPDAVDDPAAERGWFVVGADGVEVLDEMGDDRLTLTACHPKFSSRQRIVVTAQLLDEPIAPLPRPTSDPEPAQSEESEFGEGIEGQDDVLVPMLLWSGAFLLALAGTVLVAGRWRRWPT